MPAWLSRDTLTRSSHRIGVTSDPAAMLRVIASNVPPPDRRTRAWSWSARSPSNVTWTADSPRADSRCASGRVSRVRLEIIQAEVMPRSAARSRSSVHPAGFSSGSPPNKSSRSRSRRARAICPAANCRADVMPAEVSRARGMRGGRSPPAGSWPVFWKQ
jgi:hypothetical protein